jgi:hypothetical protein
VVGLPQLTGLTTATRTVCKLGPIARPSRGPVVPGAFATGRRLARLPAGVWGTLAAGEAVAVAVPDQLLGRVNAGYRLVAWGTMPLRAGLGRLLGGLHGPRFSGSGPGFVKKLDELVEVAFGGAVVQDVDADGRL